MARTKSPGVKITSPRADAPTPTPMTLMAASAAGRDACDIFPSPLKARRGPGAVKCNDLQDDKRYLGRQRKPGARGANVTIVQRMVQFYNPLNLRRCA